MSQSKIVFGLWPIAGITTVGVTEDDARATLAAAIEGGITTFDTAYSYGFDGESDRLLGEFVHAERDRFSVMGKVGQRWNADRERIVDGSRKQLTADAEESLRRLQLDAFDVLYLHAPDPQIPLEDSAETMQRLKDRGLSRRIGICNATASEIDRFASVVKTDAIQCPLNMIQRDCQSDLIEPAAGAGREVYVFWTLMKGLLAGKISRDHVFQEGDSRPGYDIFQGQMRKRVHDVLDQLRVLGSDVDQTVAQLSVGWAISQTGVTGALVGARRPEQIRETLGTRVMTAETLKRVDEIVDGCFRDL